MVVDGIDNISPLRRGYKDLNLSKKLTSINVQWTSNLFVKTGIYMAFFSLDTKAKRGYCNVYDSPKSWTVWVHR